MIYRQINLLASFLEGKMIILKTQYLPFMPKLYLLVLLCVCLISKLSAQKTAIHIKFNKPASSFEESLPLGNGRLGALVYGHTNKERIALNEITLWSGGGTGCKSR